MIRGGVMGGGQRPPTQATAEHQDSTTDGAGGVMGGCGGATPPTQIACLSPASSLKEMYMFFQDSGRPRRPRGTIEKGGGVQSGPTGGGFRRGKPHTPSFLSQGIGRRIYK